MTKQINPDGGPQQHRLAAGDLLRTAPLPRQAQQIPKCGTFCSARLPEPGQLIDGLLVEGQA